MGKRILGQSQAQLECPTAAPTGNVGVDMTLFLEASRPQWWLLTVVVSVGASDLHVWGALPAGVIDDSTDDLWGLYQDEFKTNPLGLIATALPTGTYHFLVDGLGLFSRVYFQSSANTVNVTLSEVLEADGRGS